MSQSQPLRTLSGYFWWTYERGSFHYDVMVTLILLFLFIAPHVIDFHDRPIPEVPQRSSEVLVRDAGPAGAAGHRYVYEIRADDLQGANAAAELQDRVARIVQGIAGDVQIRSIRPVLDPHRRIVAYDVTAVR